MASLVPQQQSPMSCAAGAKVVANTKKLVVKTGDLAHVNFEGLQVHLPSTSCVYHIVDGALVVDFTNFSGQLVLKPAPKPVVVLDDASPVPQPARARTTSGDTPPPARHTKLVASASNPGNSPASSTIVAAAEKKKAFVPPSDESADFAVARKVFDDVALSQQNKQQKSHARSKSKRSEAAPRRLSHPSSDRQTHHRRPVSPVIMASAGESLRDEDTDTPLALSQELAFSQEFSQDSFPFTQPSASGDSTASAAGPSHPKTGNTSAEGGANKKRGRADSKESVKITSRRVGFSSSVSTFDRARSIRAGQLGVIKAIGVSPAPRWGHSAIALSGASKMVVYGGMGDRCNTLGDTHVFDFDTCRWTNPVNSNDLPRQWHATALIPKRATMVVFGGERDISTGKPECLGELRTFDASVMCWVPAVTTGKTPAARSGTAAAVVGDSKVVIFGGSRGRKWLNEVVVLDTDSWRWSRPRVKGSAPEPRSYHTLTAVGDKVILFGGNDRDKSFGQVHVLNASDTGSWHWEQPQVLGRGPSPRTGHTATHLGNGMVVIVGGWDPNADDDSDETLPCNDAYLLDTYAWEWTELKPSMQRLASDDGAKVDSPTVALGRTGHTAVFATLPGAGPGLVICGGNDPLMDRLLNDVVFLPLPEKAVAGL